MIRGDTTLQAISPKDLLIYLCLRRYLNVRTRESTVSIATIAKETGASPVTILTGLERLREYGHITYEKRGRQNYYMLLSGIEAKSYSFLDKALPHSDKVREASKQAYVPGKKESEGDSHLYRYVAGLEDTIILLNRQVRTLTEEVNKSRKCMSVITGQTFVPIEMPENINI